MCLAAHVHGVPIEAIIDTGATISVVSRNFVEPSDIKKGASIPIEVGNGETIFTLGTTEMTLVMGEKVLKHKVHVLETDAFQAVLGTDFLKGPRCTGLITFPSPKLIFDGDQIPLRTKKGQIVTHGLFRIFKKESYTLIPEWRSKVLHELGIPKIQLTIDMFANHCNFQESMYCTRQNNAFHYDWSELCKNGEDILWANPPFSQLDKVMTKLALEKACKMVIVTPNWQGDYWMRVLEKISQKQVCIPAGVPLYKGDFDKKALPSPQWETLVTFVDTSLLEDVEKELDPKLCKQMGKLSKNWNLLDLKRNMQNYPRFQNVGTIEKEIQVGQPDIEIPESPHVSPIKPCKQEVYSLQNLEEHETYLHELAEKVEILNDVLDQIDIEFQKVGHLVQETSTILNFGDDFPGETPKAKPSSNFTISAEDQNEIANLVQQRILQLERQLASEKAELFEELPSDEEQNDFSAHLEENQDTENLHGEFEKDIKRFDDQPMLQALLRKYKDVFGPLPKPGQGCKLVEMDIELKEEFKGRTLRQKCWPMPQEDALEIEKQVQELVDANLVEPFPIGTFPKHCSPTFLVDKKESKTRRMVGQYMKLNKMTKPHAGFLPNMEEMIENMAKKEVQIQIGFEKWFLASWIDRKSKRPHSFHHSQWKNFQMELHAFWVARCPRHFPRDDGNSDWESQNAARNEKALDTKLPWSLF